jgi:hypothetical protein
MTKEVTAQRLRELISYDPQTGLFSRILKNGRTRATGTLDTDGYIRLCIDWRIHAAARLAHLYMTGSLPIHDMDHINGKRSDNRWENLREVPRRMNIENQRKAMSSSKSGILGAFWDRGKWVAKIGINGKVIHLGRFSSVEEAHEIYLAAKRRHHEGCTI